MRLSRIDALALGHLALLVAVLAVGACGGNNEPDGGAAADIAAETTDADADAAAPGPGEAADAAGASADVSVVPDWFPGDVYVPEAYSVVVARDLGAVQQVELRVDGEVDALAARARASMQANDWTESMRTGPTTGYTKEQRIANLSVSERDDGSARVTYQFSTL